MNARSFTLQLTLDADPSTVFDAIVDVRGWWSGTIDGRADALGAEFRYRYADMHDSTQRVTELVRSQKIVWRVLDAHLSFVDEPGEWKGSDIVFELVPRGRRTVVTFTHVGLSSTCQCYEACLSGWSTLLTRNLRKRVATGEAQPDAFA